MKKSARHDCPLVDPCQPIYHPPSLEKANRAFDRWVRAVRWEVWTRRVARVLAPAGVPFADVYKRQARRPGIDPLLHGSSLPSATPPC